MTGAPPCRYLKDLRLGAAAALLIEPRLSVKEVAMQVGFGDLSHFTRDFREAYEQSPTTFRRTVWSGAEMPPQALSLFAIK